MWHSEWLTDGEKSQSEELQVKFTGLLISIPYVSVEYIYS